MHTTLNTFISSMHQDWYNSISTNLLATLNQNLLAQVWALSNDAKALAQVLHVNSLLEVVQLP